MKLYLSMVLGSMLVHTVWAQHLPPNDASYLRCCSDAGFEEVDQSTLPTWDEQSLPLPNEVRAASPPSSATNLRKWVHVAVASSTTPTNSSHKDGGLYVYTSFGGQRWDRVATVFTHNAGATTASPHLACNTRSTRCHAHFRNHLYLVFLVNIKRNDGQEFDQVMYTRSVDGGNTFMQPIRLDIAGGRPENPTVIIASTDEVTVTWTDAATGQTVSLMSHNGDTNFTPRVR